MKKTMLTAATLFAFATTGAMAQVLDFASVDTDMSGTISFAELQAVLPNITGADFAILDADGSGELSEEEFAVLMVPPSQ